MLKFVSNALINAGINGWYYFLIPLMLYSCNFNSENSLKYQVLEDRSFNAGMAWAEFENLSLDRNGLFNAGITPSIWWMKFKIVNTKTQSATYFFTLNNPHINLLELYEPFQQTPALVLGDRFPFDQRPFKDRDLIIPFYLDSLETKEFLLKVDKAGETLLVDPKIFNEPTFFQRKTAENLLMGLIMGWFLIMVIVAFLYLIQLRNWSAVLFIGFILSHCFWLISHWGYGFQFFWPENTDWVGKSRPVFNLLTNVFLLSLIIVFFPKLQKLKYWTYFILGCIAIQTFLVIDTFRRPEIIIPIAEKILFLRLVFGFSILMTILVLIYLILHLRNKTPYSGYFLAGISFLISFNVMVQTHQLGVSLQLPNLFVDFGSVFGVLGETFFIMLAFIAKAAGYKKEKERLTIAIIEKDKEMAEQLINIQEKERTRLGRDLHDSVGGILSSIYLEVGRLKEKFNEKPLFDTLLQMIETSVQEVRSISHDLTPPYLDEIGLQKVLENKLRQLKDVYHMEVYLYYEVKSPLSKKVELNMYRICSEWIHNIIKHAEATELNVQVIEEDDSLQLMFEDNGKGMEPEKAKQGLGLESIQNRVFYLKGNMHLDSSSNGTTLIIQIPSR